MCDVVGYSLYCRKRVSLHFLTKDRGGEIKVLFPVFRHLILVSVAKAKVRNVLAIVELVRKRNRPGGAVEARGSEHNASQIMHERLEEERTSHKRKVRMLCQQRLQ